MRAPCPNTTYASLPNECYIYSVRFAHKIGFG